MRDFELDIKSIGGEFELIRRLLEKVPKHHANLVKGVGDDAAVMKSNGDEDSLILFTTDMLVENTHFKRRWTSAKQIGMKSVECNVSDIAAMGGKPTFMFVSLILPDNTDVLWLQSLYEGLGSSCKKRGLILTGGDTTKGEIFAINIALLGSVTSGELCLRSHAKPGDILAVTGYLGGAFAGLKMLLSGKMPSTYLLNKHITPKCRLTEALRINSIVNAMIDISDGLSSEIHHICDNSDTGVEIYEGSLPIHYEVKKVAKVHGNRASNYAMMGGEDLELLFTFDPKHLGLLNNTGVSYHAIGKISESSRGRVLMSEHANVRKLTSRGYDHFT